MTLECMDCNRQFTRRQPTENTTCPSCGSTDIDVSLALLVSEVLGTDEPHQAQLFPASTGRIGAR